MVRRNKRNEIFSNSLGLKKNKLGQGVKMEEEKEVGAEATTENAGTAEVTETKKSFDELLQDKEYQSAFDKKIAQSLQTAKAKWEEDNKTKQAEAERLAKMDEDQKKNYELEQERTRANKAESELNAYRLKDETIRQASGRGISIEYLDTIDFSRETAESINVKLDIFERTSKADREKAIREYSKEPPPQTGDKTKSQENLSGYEKFLKNYK